MGNRFCSNCNAWAQLVNGSKYCGPCERRELPRVHRFKSTGEAYDAAQCDDEIKDGDVLVAGFTVAVLVECWPTLVRGEAGAFHALAPGFPWSDVEGGRYLPSVALAAQL